MTEYDFIEEMIEDYLNGIITLNDVVDIFCEVLSEAVSFKMEEENDN